MNDAASFKKISLVGSVQRFYWMNEDVKTMPHRFIWDYGEADIKIKGITGDTVAKIRGIIPRCGPDLNFVFTHYASESQKNIKTMIKYEMPRLDQSRVRLTADMIIKVLRTEVILKLPDSLKKAPLFLCINPMCLVYQREAVVAVSAYDAEHGTSFALQLDLMIKAATTMSDSIPVKALVVVQLLQFFHHVYNVNFYSLMMLELSVIISLFSSLQMNGPVDAFRLARFKFDEFGVLMSVDLNVKPGAHDLSFATDDKEVIEQDGGNKDGDTFGVSAVGKPREVNLTMGMKRALDAYKAQKLHGALSMRLADDEKDEDEDDDDDDSVAADSARAKMRMLFEEPATQPKVKGDSKSSSSSIVISGMVPGGKSIVFMSTDYKKTRPLPIDMSQLSRDAWLRIVVIEFFRSQYKDHQHFCVPKELLMELVTDINDLDDFPIADVTIAEVEATLLNMMDNEEVYIYDLTEMRGVSRKEIEKRYAGQTFVETSESLMYGLASIFGIELGICDLLDSFLVSNQSLRDIDIAVAKSKIKLVKETSKGPLSLQQQQSVVYAQLLPFVVVNGVAGAGKSLVMVEVFVALRTAYPKDVFLFTAFKNDTVNQMREALEQRCESLLDPKLVFFMTTDMYIMKGIELLQQKKKDKNAKAPQDSMKKMTTKKETEEVLDVSYCFVDEAAMLSSSHVYRMLQQLTTGEGGQKLKKILMFGDSDQLEPVGAGCFFKSAVKCLTPVNITLTKNYRASSVKLNSFLQILRTQDVDATIEFDQEYDMGDADACSFLLDSVPDKYRTDEEVMKRYGAVFMSALTSIDPHKKHYRSLMAVCPYNNMSDYISCLIEMYYHQTPDPGEPHTSRKKIKMMDTEGDEDEGDGGVVAKRKWTEKDALEYSKGMLEKKKEMVLRVGMDVVVLKTDPENKMMAAGRVGEITKIIYHLQDQKIDPVSWGKKSHNVVPHGTKCVQDTFEPLPPGKYAISIVIDADTIATFPWGNRIYMWLKPSKCRTVHRAQGRQAEFVIGIYPPGQLSNYRIVYTGQSRSKSKSVIITPKGHLLQMMKTNPDVRHSAQDNILLGAIDIQDELQKHKQLADAVFTGLRTCVDMEDDDFDD